MNAGSNDVLLGHVGLGAMGGPMATRLAGWPGGLIVYDRRADAMTPLGAAGARLAAGAGEVAAADGIGVAVLDDEQVREVVAGPDGIGRHAAPGTVIAIHSTISDSTARELAQEFAPHGVHVIDAPVSGGPAAAAEGRLATMVGAPRAVYERVKPVFKQWAALVVHAGEPGDGTRMKLARNMVTFVGFAAACEAMTLAERAGLDLQALGRVVRHTDALTGGPGAIMVRDNMSEIEPGHWLYDSFTHTRDLGEKDLRLALALGERTGTELPLVEEALRGLAADLGVPHPRTAEPE